MTIRDELERIQTIDKEIDELIDEYNASLERATKITPVYKDMCVQESNIDGSKIEQCILERFEIRKKLEQKLSEFETLKTKLNNLINQIDDVQSRRLLKLRYFQYLEWEEIREHLNYGSLEYVRGELHGKSLQKLLKLHT